MAQKIQFVVCVLHKPKCDFDEPFLVLTPMPISLKDEILALRDEGATIIFLRTVWKVWKSFVIISP
jgi:ABC-2 type transport system ATP-binding protein